MLDSDQHSRLFLSSPCLRHSPRPSLLGQQSMSTTFRTAQCHRYNSADANCLFCVALRPSGSGTIFLQFSFRYASLPFQIHRPCRHNHFVPFVSVWMAPHIAPLYCPAKYPQKTQWHIRLRISESHEKKSTASNGSKVLTRI